MSADSQGNYVPLQSQRKPGEHLIGRKNADNSNIAMINFVSTNNIKE